MTRASCKSVRRVVETGNITVETYRSLHCASLRSSLSLVCDGISNLVALIFRARVPFVIILVRCHLSSVLRLGSPVSTG